MASGRGHDVWLVAAEKGPELAIEVARRVGRRLRMAIRVNQADEHDDFAAHIAPAVDRGEVELVEVASHADTCALLGDAAAVLFPISWPEPFGLVPIEANACGTPVVAFANGALPELIQHGRNGLQVAPGDLKAFTDAMTCRWPPRHGPDPPGGAQAKDQRPWFDVTTGAWWKLRRP